MIAETPTTATPPLSDRGEPRLLAALDRAWRRVEAALRPEAARGRKPRWELADGAAAALGRWPRGAVLRCERGLFLVTQAGDPEDHVLEEGAEHRPRPRGRVVAWALRGGVLVVR
jgi:hypothetical protein